MCDLNWCPVCDKAISHESDSLYCSINCFMLDTKSQVNPSKFLTFLKPKSFMYKKKQEISMPKLTKSIYTSSTFSNRLSSYNLSNRLSSDFFFEGSIDDDDDDLQLPECCDFCDRMKNQVVHQEKSSWLFDDKPYHSSSSPIFIPIP